MAVPARKQSAPSSGKVVELKNRAQHDHDEDQEHEEHDPFAGGHGTKHEEGEGPWLVSYADMMTLLMGFFALMASFSKPDAKEFEKVKAATSEYFGTEYEAPYQKLAQNINKVIKENNLEKQVKVEAGPDGVTMTFTGTMFFESGDFHVKAEATAIMDKLAGAIQKTAQGYNAIIEGHTDNVPIEGDVIASNWELSAIRAARIAQLFETQGFAKSQLTIMGWGETRPVVPNENPDGSPNIENRSKNRRVVIRVYKELPK